MNKLFSIWLLAILVVFSTNPFVSFAQDDGDFAPSGVGVPNEADEPSMVNPSMAMPSDGEFDAAPAPTDWEEDVGDEEIEGEDF